MPQKISYQYLYHHPLGKTDELIVNTRELVRDFKKIRTILERKQTNKVKINKTLFVIQLDQPENDAEQFRRFFQNYYKKFTKIKIAKAKYEIPVVKDLKVNDYAA